MKNLIAISGHAGAGKNLVCTLIQELCKENNGPQYEQKAFAGKLKQIASLLTGIPVEKFEDQEFKKTLLGPEWGTINHNPLNNIPVFEDIQFNELMSAREFLQKLGTDAIRDNLHKNTWVNALFTEYKEKIYRTEVPIRAAGFIDYYAYPNWIITDLRFPNELKAIQERNGLIIRVNSPYIRYSDGSYRAKSKMMGDFDNKHESETALDGVKFDYTIVNDSTIEDLREKIKEILIKEKII